ncbi:DUF5008 domain-containing protein [Mucilaginibacter mali]|uniref:DUF5008 domain-containing protein n=1 Tax=Mucilaginibacter mali TaxID=2740462 RepID=A0A7D4UMH5_9SPHI|nr:DUF5008 domain-containing protein [Mucilaginibacter mali]QKJ31081.1 DUF5008 domain-containing protein [Mucilaginibacter mali]
MNHFISKQTIRLGKLVLALAVLGLCSCKKEIIGENPYGGGKQPLGVKFGTGFPDPEVAAPGTEVNVSISGLKKYENKYKFYVNEVEATVLASTDSTARIKVPNDASSGGMSVIIDGQTFFGPLLRIDGKVSIDASFQATVGSNSTIYDILRLPTSNYLLTGAFNNFDNRAITNLPIGGIAQINAQGVYATTLTFGKGASGTVYNVNRLSNGKLLLSGAFASFNSTRGKRININGITTLNSDGTLDSTIIDVINPTPNDFKKNKDTVPTFNGGVTGMIRKSFVFNDRIYAVGRFESYLRVYYDRSTYDTKVYDVTRIKQMVCMKMDGSMDSTFHFDMTTKQSPAAGNGEITDAIQQADGKLILVGAFSTFNGTAASHIVRINLDGSVDQTFKAGAGADNNISSITYNATTNKIFITGAFTTYGGSAKKGVAMLNADGSIDNSFNFGALSAGVATYAAQLSSGKIIVAGNFKTYNSVVRQGFMILNPDASLAAGYNNTGQFDGQLFEMIETTSSLGNPAVILVGSIQRFDNKKMGNIVRVEIKN